MRPFFCSYIDTSIFRAIMLNSTGRFEMLFMRLAAEVAKTGDKGIIEVTFYPLLGDLEETNIRERCKVLFWDRRHYDVVAHFADGTKQWGIKSVDEIVRLSEKKAPRLRSVCAIPSAIVTKLVEGTSLLRYAW